MDVVGDGRDVLPCIRLQVGGGGLLTLTRRNKQGKQNLN